MERVSECKEEFPAHGKNSAFGQRPLPSCLRPLPCFQDTWGPVPDPIIRRCSGHLGLCLTCSLPWSSHRASNSRQMLGTSWMKQHQNPRIHSCPPWSFGMLKRQQSCGRQSSTLLPGRPHRPACHVCQLVLGPAASLEILFLETGAGSALPRQLPEQWEVLPPAQHLQLSLRLFPSGLLGALPRGQ